MTAIGNFGINSHIRQDESRVSNTFCAKATNFVTFQESVVTTAVGWPCDIRCVYD